MREGVLGTFLGEDGWVAPFPLTPGWRHYYPALLPTRRCPNKCCDKAGPSRWSDTNTNAAPAGRPYKAPVKVQVDFCHRVDTWSRRINSCTCTCLPPRALASPANPSIIFFYHRQPQLGSTSACAVLIALQLCLPEHLPMNLLKGWIVLGAAKGSLTLPTTSASASLLPSRVGQVVGGGLCPATG